MEMLIGNFAIGEVNELQNIYITVLKFKFQIFQGFFKCKIFTFITLHPSGTTKANISKCEKAREIFVQLWFQKETKLKSVK